MLLAAGELGGQVVGPIGQTHLRKQTHRQRVGFGTRQAVHVDRSFHHVLEGRSVGEQMELLEDHPCPSSQLLTPPPIGRLRSARLDANISQAQRSRIGCF